MVWPEGRHKGAFDTEAEIEAFGALNIIDRLAGGDVLKWEAVSLLDNSTVLGKMRLDSTHARHERNIQEYERMKYGHQSK